MHREAEIMVTPADLQTDASKASAFETVFRALFYSPDNEVETIGHSLEAQPASAAAHKQVKTKAKVKTVTVLPEQTGSRMYLLQTTAGKSRPDPSTQPATLTVPAQVLHKENRAHEHSPAPTPSSPD